jgi:diguanylate cyclase (GGDEF)-like protein
VFGGAAALIVVGCSVLALIISAYLQRRVSRPILDLAETARHVTSERNFSIRAPLAGGDEVGILVQDFNRMLGEIEHQDLQLRHQQEQLTVQVAHRTAELVAANDQLRNSVERVERYAAQIAQLTSLGQLLQSCRTDGEVFGVVSHAMLKLFPEGAGALSLLRADNHLMEVVAIWGDEPPSQRVFDADDCWAFRRGRPHAVAEFESPVRCGHLTGVDGPVTYCVPMVAQGDTIGLLQFNFGPGDEPDATDENGTVLSTRGRLVVALAEHVATALSNLRLREALRNQSIVDALTGLFNRRYLTDVLERECRRAVRSGRSLAVLMLDVDHFKRFNDTWGHDGGDIVLRELAAVLRASFRGDDVACRYGGEEFVMLLAEASMESAYARAEQLRLMVHRLSAELRGQPLGSITVSIGVALLPDHGMTPEELIASADRALYEAKSRGRDRTVRAPAVSRLTSTGGAD